MKQKSIALTMIVFVTAGIWSLLPAFCEGAGGNTEDDNQCYEIKYEVPLVPQQTPMSCWAASFAMLIAWRDGMPMEPAKIAEPLGYKKKYDKDGLEREDTAVINHWELQAGEPMCYSLKAFKDLIETYGPLWVATNRLSPHARVITGMTWDGTVENTRVNIYRPPPPGGVLQYDGVPWRLLPVPNWNVLSLAVHKKTGTVLYSRDKSQPPTKRQQTLLPFKKAASNPSHSAAGAYIRSIIITAAKVSTACHKCPMRRFSFDWCWLLS